MKKLYILIGLILSVSFAYTQTGNTFTGTNAGISNTTGDYNTFTGYNSGRINTEGSENVFNGANSGYYNTTATRNTFTGFYSGFKNTTGYHNTFYGAKSGQENTTGNYNTFNGSASGYYNTTGYNNSFYGLQSGYSNTTGYNNTFNGMKSGYSNTTGNQNTFNGIFSGYNNTTGYNNTFSGDSSGYYNTTAAANTFYGKGSGKYNTTGERNTFTGTMSGYHNTTGDDNTFHGYYSGYNNTTGAFNTFTGEASGVYNTEGSYNTFTGESSGGNNTTGYENTFLGFHSGYHNTTGTTNICIGAESGWFNGEGHDNIYIGKLSGIYCVNGVENIAIGGDAGFSGDCTNAISIGFYTYASASNTVRIGNDYITQIGGIVGWSNLSDGRFKKEVGENVAGLDFIRQLHPVSYKIDLAKLKASRKSAVAGNEEEKTESLPEEKTESKQCTGFIAQEVEKIVKDNGYVFAGVHAPENDNDQYSICYTDFIAPLVKAVQELDSLYGGKISQLEETINQQQDEISLLKTLISDNVSDVKSDIQLMQNYPNPFSNNTEIEMYLPENIGNAQIKIFTLEGKTLLIVPVTGRGNTSVTISGGTLADGLYLYGLIADGKLVSYKRMVLTK